MAVTWRTVTAPNQSGANQAASQGIQTILAGLGGTAKALQQGTKDEEEREKLKFQQAIQLAGLGQNQQKIDNQDSQAGAVLAQGDRRMSLQQGQFESAQAFKERQQSKQYQQQLALQQGQQNFQSREKGLDRDFKKDIQQSGFKQQDSTLGKQQKFTTSEREAKQQYLTAAKEAGYKNAKEAQQAGFTHAINMQGDSHKQQTAMQKAGFTHRESIQDDQQEFAGVEAQKDRYQQRGMSKLDYKEAIGLDNNRTINDLVVQDDAQAHSGEVAVQTMDKQIQLEKAKQTRDEAKIILEGRVAAQLGKGSNSNKGGRKDVLDSTVYKDFIANSSSMSEDGKKNLAATMQQAQAMEVPPHAMGSLMTYMFESSDWSFMDDESRVDNMSPRDRQNLINQFVVENPELIQNKSVQGLTQSDEQKALAKRLGL